MDIIQEHIKLLRAQFALIQKQCQPVKRYRAGRNCRKGYNCGGSCITRSKNCRKALEGEAKNFSEWMINKMSGNMGAVLGEKPVDQEVTRKTRTPEEVAKIKPTKERIRRTTGRGPGSYDVENDVEYFDDNVAIFDRRNIDIETGKKSGAAMGISYEVSLVDPASKEMGKIPLGRGGHNNRFELGYYKTKKAALGATRELLEKGLTGETAMKIQKSKNREEWDKFLEESRDVHRKYLDQV